MARLLTSLLRKARRIFQVRPTATPSLANRVTDYAPRPFETQSGTSKQKGRKRPIH